MKTPEMDDYRKTITDLISIMEGEIDAAKTKQAIQHAQIALRKYPKDIEIGEYRDVIHSLIFLMEWGVNEYTKNDWIRSSRSILESNVEPVISDPTMTISIPNLLSVPIPKIERLSDITKTGLYMLGNWMLDVMFLIDNNQQICATNVNNKTRCTFYELSGPTSVAIEVDGIYVDSTFTDSIADFLGIKD
jgi:hypothetical protein